MIRFFICTVILALILSNSIAWGASKYIYVKGAVLQTENADGKPSCKFIFPSIAREYLQMSYIKVISHGAGCEYDYVNGKQINCRKCGMIVKEKFQPLNWENGVTIKEVAKKEAKAQLDLWYPKDKNLKDVDGNLYKTKEISIK